MDKSYYKTIQKTRVCSSKVGCVSYSHHGWALLNMYCRSKVASFPQRTKKWRQGIIVHKEIFLIGVKWTPIPRAQSITYADVKTQSAVRLLNAAITWEWESVCLSAFLFVCLCLYRGTGFHSRIWLQFWDIFLFHLTYLRNLTPPRLRNVD